MPRSVQYVYRSQNLLKLNMQCQRTIPKENTKNKPPSLTFFKIPRTWSFRVVVLQRTATKCTKNYNARAQLLFCSLNLLFCGVLVAVAVVVCLKRAFVTLLRKSSSLISYPTEHFSKLIFVRKILLHRPCEACENRNTAIGGLLSHP